ncbi:MAG TPA: hypothetical protein VGG09_15700 [Acidimicrobiales bacterium]
MSSVVAMALCAGAMIVALAAPPAGALVAPAKGGAANTYKLSGAVTGTLDDGPTAGCPYGGINNNGFVDLNDLVGSVSGITGVASWSLDVTVKKNGTYSFRALAARTPTAILSVNLKGKNITQSIEKGQKDNFFAHGGTVTVKGEAGSIDASMSQIGGKTLKIVAQWDCGAPAAQAAVSGHGWKLAALVASNKEGSGPGIATHTANFSSVSCPTAEFCAAVDDTGNAFTFNGKTWSKGVVVDSTAGTNMNDEFASVSCASSSFCIAGDDLSDVYTFNGSTWSTTADQLNPSGMSASVSFSVSCPTTSFCMAVDGNTDYYAYNGTSWSQPQVIDSTTLNATTIGEVSCASPTFCEAVYNDHSVTYNGTAWSSPLTLSLPPGTKSGSNPEVSAVSCPAATFCAVGGTTAANVAYLNTFNGTSWSTGLTLNTNLGPQSFADISCPTSSFCMAGGLDGWVTYGGSSWSKPQTFANAGGPPGTGPLYANSMSCPSTTFCEEVESNGYADSWTG